MGTSCLLLPGAVWLGLSVHPRLQESRFLGPILSSMKPTNDAFRHVSPWPVGTRRLPSFRMKGIRGIKTKAGNWRKAVSPESTSDDTVQENLDLASPDIEVSGQQHSGFNSWLPPEKKEMEECSGWSTPLGLDRTLTDVFVHAGLPEVVAGVALAVGIGLFSYTALQRRGTENFVSTHEGGNSIVNTEHNDDTCSSDGLIGIGDDDLRTYRGATEQRRFEGEGEKKNAVGDVLPQVALPCHPEALKGAAGSGSLGGGQDPRPLFEPSQRDQDEGIWLGPQEERGELLGTPEVEISNDDEQNGAKQTTRKSIASIADRELQQNLVPSRTRSVEKSMEVVEDKGDEKIGRHGTDFFVHEGQENPGDPLLPFFRALQAAATDAGLQESDLTGITGASTPDVALKTSQSSAHLTPAPVFSSRNGAGLEVSVPKVIVAAAVDQSQAQALEALQALKVIEGDIVAGDICTRREYARWLITASSTLSSSSARKVFPAMYIENVTELAFQDVSAEDPDFPYIQGLAEAGLIKSRLSHMDVINNENDGQAGSGVSSALSDRFLPDSPVRRQDLISWKIALEQRTLPAPDKQILRAVSGLIDVDRIDIDALPAVAFDILQGDGSMISSAFGYTRRFEPSKPVTHGQAAIALAYGEAGDIVSEELARLDAEKIAEAAVEAAAAAEAAEQRAEQELGIERMHRQGAEELLKESEAFRTSLVLELQQEREKWEEHMGSYLKEALGKEKEELVRRQAQVEETAQQLLSSQKRLAAEQGAAYMLQMEVELQQQSARSERQQIDLEREQLAAAKSRTEEATQKAEAQALQLEEIRRKLEVQFGEEGANALVQRAREASPVQRPTPGLKEIKARVASFHMAVLKAINGNKFVSHVDHSFKEAARSLTCNVGSARYQAMRYLGQAVDLVYIHIRDLKSFLLVLIEHTKRLGMEGAAQVTCHIARVKHNADALAQRAKVVAATKGKAGGDA